jgi:subtilisin family serine protease
MIENNKNKIVIAVIDSGIVTSVSDLQNYVIKSTGYRVNSEGFISELPDIKPNGLHGTAVALIIRDICKNVKLISINILNERMATDSRIMIYAMNEVLKFNPDIIHMSLGTTNWRYRSYLKKIVSMANEKNIIIVAACNNSGFWSYPASINGVIGVKSAKTNTIRKNIYYKKKKFYYAPYTMQDIYGVDALLESGKMMGTSMAAAYITGHIANIKSNENPNCINEIVKSLNNKIR